MVEKCILESGLHCHRFIWGYDQLCDLQVLGIDKIGKISTITCKFGDETIVYTIPFTDDASVENSLHCLSTWILLETVIEHKPLNMELIASRMQVR